MDEKISGLKTQFPNQFETPGTKKIIENKLEDGEQGEAEPQNLEDALKLAYGPKND